MAECIVKRDYQDWKGGDHIEVYGSRLKELVDMGVVEVVKLGVEELPVEKPLTKVLQSKKERRVKNVDTH